MYTCQHCGQRTAPDRRDCGHCGYLLPPESERSQPRKRELPSFIWLLLIVGGIVVFIGGMIGSVVFLSTVEGVASLVLLLIAFFAGRVWSGERSQSTPGMRGVALAFFALMGMALDQPGNFLYNLPIGALSCPAGSSLDRSTSVSHPRAGRTEFRQRFRCLDEAGQQTRQVPMHHVLGVRFLEYVVLGYLLIGIKYLRWRFRRKDEASPQP
jgi:hypothetical protein